DDVHYSLGNSVLAKGAYVLAIAHYKQALEIRLNWEKGQIALESAQAEQAAQAEKTAQGSSGTHRAPGSAVQPDSNTDPARMLDPNFHGNFLRDLHDIVVETDKHSQVMLEFLQKEVDEAIRG